MRNLPAAVQFADRFNSSDEVIDAARSIAADYACRPLDSTSSNLLGVLTRIAKPVAAIEVGTGTGVSTVSILHNMPAAGVLTSIDVDAQRQAVTSELLQLAGITGHRARFITGPAETVMQRLAHSTYDLVFIDADPPNYPHLVGLGYAKLAPGGVLIVHNVMDGGNVANPAARAPATRAARQTLELIEDLKMQAVSLLPIDSGLIAGVK